MRASLLPILGFWLVVGGVGLCWVLTVALDHREGAFLPYISETGMYAPERYVFTFALGTAAVLFAVSAYLLFRHLQHQFDDVGDFYYGFIDADSSSENDGRYDRERIHVWGTERVMLSYLPKANYVALALSLLACASLLFLAIVDLRDAHYYHASASALFFGISLLQGFFLTCLTYALRRVKTRHDRASSLRFYAKVVTLFMCLFFTFPIALLESVVITAGHVDLSDARRHSIGAVNQYLLTISLLLHFVTYSSDVRGINVALNLQLNVVDGIIALDGRRSSFSGRSSTSFLEGNEPIGSSRAKENFSIADSSEEEAEPKEEQGIRFVNKSSSVRQEKEMNEIIPMEALHLEDS